jgi:tetratricopeptide (TPR) repeat protein
MPLSILLSYLYLQWQCKDGKPSRYAALITFMNIWMWDGKEESFFPQTQARKLFEWVESDDRQIRAVALSGAVLMAVRYGEKMPKEFLDMFQHWADNELLKEEFIEVQKYLLMSITGLKMQKKLHEEVFDKMHKEQQILREKLGLTDDEEERMEIAEEGNKKMMSYVQKMNTMIQDGIDMNIGTFAALKGMEFFKELRNWFIDFDINHPGLDTLGEKKKLANALFGHAELCDLDKYALTSVINKIASVEAMNQQLPPEVLEQMGTGGMKEKVAMERQHNAYRYTFQTLFRFFQLSPWKDETTNPFRLGPFLTDHNILAPLVTDDFLWENSNLFIRNSFYSHPATYLRTWMARNGQTNEALELLAHCHKHLGDTRSRLECLLELEKRNPEDMRLVQETGLCLVHEKRFDEALQRFFHLEVTEHYLRGSARAIAWCSIMTGNIARAGRYYKKLLEWQGGPSWEDLLNAGHCAWLAGDPVEASALYQRYLSMHKDNLMAFDNDHDTLLSLGFTADDIRLMRDTVNEANTYLPFRNNNRSAKN